VRSLVTVVVAPDGPYAQARSRILHHFDTQAATKLSRGPDHVALTRSETAVLHYLPSHLTNEEIADDLCVSINTIKSHLRSLYRKLAVANRRETISRARQLDLLP
jgi:LuxR family maltose regulon positive regulatory protein